MKIAFTTLLVLLLVGCSSDISIIEAPPPVREKALICAQKYIGTPYVYGGKHVSNAGGVDCSGLVLDVYQYALNSYGYTLLFSDCTVETLYNNFTQAINIPTPGDLIFMGDDSTISHVALFEHETNGIIYFIDAYSIDGKVEERNYLATDPKIKCFGRMLIYSN
jgi:hypothetical protein